MESREEYLIALKKELEYLRDDLSTEHTWPEILAYNKRFNWDLIMLIMMGQGNPPDIVTEIVANIRKILADRQHASLKN